MAKYNRTDTNLNDYLDSVSRGDIVGDSVVFISGKNADINGTAEDLWGESTSLTYLTSAETMEVNSSSAADTSAGTGMQSIVIFGSGDDNEALFEIVTMNGTSDVTTVNAYKRINSVLGFVSGSCETNAGIIRLTSTTAGTVQAHMEAGISIAVQGFRTIPAGKAAIIKQIELDGTRLTGGQLPLLTFKVYARRSGAGSPWFVILERQVDTAVDNQLVIPFPLSAVLDAGTDIRLNAATTVTNSIVSMRVTLLEYDV